MRRAIAVMTAYVGNDEADMANTAMNETLQEGIEAFTDLAAGLLFVASYLLGEYAEQRGESSFESLRALALKVAGP